MILTRSKSTTGKVFVPLEGTAAIVTVYIVSDSTCSMALISHQWNQALSPETSSFSSFLM